MRVGKARRLAAASRSDNRHCAEPSDAWQSSWIASLARNDREAHAPHSSSPRPCSSPAAPPARSRPETASRCSPDQREPRGLIGLTAQRAGRPFRQPRAPGPRRRPASSSSSAAAAACSTPISIRRKAMCCRVTHVDTRTLVGRRLSIRRPASPRSNSRAAPAPSARPRRPPGRGRQMAAHRRRQARDRRCCRPRSGNCGSCG